MERQPVSSSLVKSVGYDVGTETLEVDLNGTVYAYYHVPASVYRELMDSESLGRYFALEIRDQYWYSRV